MLDQLQDLLTETITVEPWTAINEYGVATYGVPASYRGRVERTVRQAQNAHGDFTLVPSYKIFIGAAVQIDVRDRVTLPVIYGQRDETGVFVAPSVNVRVVQPIMDEQGHVLTVLHCG